MTRLHRDWRAWLALVLVLGLVTVEPVQAQKVIRKNDKQVLTAFREVVAKPSHWTVVVSADGKDAAYGTIVGQDGWIVTKASELPPRAKLSVKARNGKTYPASLVGVQEKYDLGMLKVDAGDLQPVEWADSKSAEVGDWLAAPGIGDDAVAIGVVSVAAREPKIWEMPMPPPPTDSGFLGVLLGGDEGSPPRVESIEKQSAAEKAGLKVGDLVLSVQGEQVADVQSLISRVQKFKAGDIITLNVKRGGKEQRIDVTLGKRPATPKDSRSDYQNNLGSTLSKRRGGFPTIMQTDLVIPHNACGGPAVTLDGKAVGVFIARAGRTESYIIPSENVQALLDDLKSGKLKPVDPTPVLNIKDLEAALTRAKLAVDAHRRELRTAQAAKEPNEVKIQRLTEELAVLEKTQQDAQKKLDAARRDVTKKE